jgi:hypothetical protein
MFFSLVKIKKTSKCSILLKHKYATSLWKNTRARRMLQSIIGIPKILNGPMDTFDFTIFFLLLITADYVSVVIDVFEHSSCFDMRYMKMWQKQRKILKNFADFSWTFEKLTGHSLWMCKTITAVLYEVGGGGGGG